MRMGRVFLDYEYIVDLDNPGMVEKAKNTIITELLYAVKHNEIDRWPATEEAPDADECDIASILLHEDGDE